MSIPANENGSAAQKSTVTLSQAEFDTLNKRVKDNRDQAMAAQQSTAELKKEKSVLMEQLNSTNVATASLSADEGKKLDELKYSDPDAWMAKVTALKQTSQSSLDGMLSEARTAAGVEIKKQTNQEAINSFMATNPAITIERLEAEVPYGLKSSFDSGSIGVQEFLTEANKFFSASAGSNADAVLSQTSLKDLGGDVTASKTAIHKESADSYESATF